MKTRIEKIFDLVAEPVIIPETQIEIRCNTCCEIFKQKRTQSVLGFLYITCKKCRINTGVV